MDALNIADGKAAIEAKSISMSGLRTDIVARRSKLSAEQLALLERRLRGQASMPAPEPINRRPAQERPALSFAQQRLWFLDQLDPGNPFYNVPRVLRFRGPINRAALSQSLTEIARRHESLRTVFADDNGDPVQVIGAAVAVDIPMIDLSQLPPDVREAEARQLALNESEWRFDLHRGPLLRVVLLRHEEEDHLVLLVMHHIITDGWSMGVLIKEVTTLYETFSSGGRSPLPEPSIQYADFAYWQRQRLQGDELEKHLGYWRKQLGDAPTILDLPADRTHPPVQSHRGAFQPVRIPKDVADALKSLSRQEGATLFMALLAGFKTLLYRYTSQRHILVGTPIANRNREEVEGLIGFFVNTLVLRTSFDGNATFRDVLKQVRETTLGAFAHQDFPFERLVEELQPERNLSRTPLFQVMFILQNLPSSELQLSGLTLTAQDVYTASAKFDLSWTAIETEQGIAGGIEYNTDIFDAATVERMAKNLLTLLESSVADPSMPVSRLEILSEAEREFIRVEQNAANRERVMEECAHQMFEHQVERTPQRTAVVFEDRELTYSELNARANQLAHYLNELGIGPESRVAIALERSVEMLVAVLGVLKAGAAYVPLDPAYPLERRAFMLADSRSEALITREEHAAGLFAEGTRIVCLGREDDLIAQYSEQNLVTGVEPDNLAYIIYTSGSTGRPKGIGLPHRALANLIEWHCETLSNGARTMQFASLSFDASFHEMFAAWASGGTLFPVAEMLRMDAPALAEMIDRHEIEKVILPVVMLQEIARERAGVTNSLQSLKEIITTGEQLQVTTAIRDLLARLPECSLHNHYGPSETHVVTAYVFDGEARSWPSWPPIGKAISNSRLYVLDENQRPVPVGVYGEVCIGGDCLARGYFARPEATAERFIPDPQSSTGGERMYRTGDVGRLLPDGNIEYVGRRDDQVKIRGFRVEPGELEAALVRHPAIREAVALVREDTAGDKRLVVYVVADAGSHVPEEPEERGSRISTSEIRAYLAQSLPDYMLPSAFVMMDALPLTTNGKVDRRALPPPGDVRNGLQREYAAPAGEVEESVAKIWAVVLGVERAGVEDNFFELGGHSLKATQVISRIQKLYGDKVRLRDLFDSPTIRGLAQKIEKQSGLVNTPTGESQKRIERVGEKAHYNVSSAQRRVWIVCQQKEASRAYNLPKSYVLEGKVDEAALRLATRGLVTRHESLRTSFIVVNGEPKQRVGSGDEIELDLIDLTQAETGEEERQEAARQIARNEARVLFDLERGPLIRAKLIKVADERRVFLLTLHHIIADGWSVNVLMRELMQMYRAFRDGRENPLRPLEIQYRDYAEWENQTLSGERLEEQRRYWTRKLSGQLEPVRIEGDYEQEEREQYRGGIVPYEISEEVTEGLKKFGRARGASLYMSLLAGVYALLYRHTGQEDLVVACPVSGRKRQELEDQVGMYLNTLLLKTRTSGDTSMGELLERVKETTLEAFEHQDYPYEQLVRELNVKREAGKAPLMEVVVSLEEREGGTTAGGEDEVIDGLRIGDWGEWNGVSKNDLWFGFKEFGGRLAGAINYNSDKFREETIREIAASLSQVLGQMIEDESVKVMDVNLGDAGDHPTAEPETEIDIELAI